MEKEELEKQILSEEVLIARLEERQQRVSEGVSTPHLANTYILKTDKNTDIAFMAADYVSNDAVIYAEPNYIAKVNMITNFLVR